MHNKNVRYKSILKIKDWFRHMTIAIGIKCKDGVVIGSDSQLTYEGVPLKKLGYEKIFETEFIEKNYYILTGAGIPAYIYGAHTELYNRCKNNNNVTNILNFKKECEYSINAICRHYIVERSQNLGLLGMQENYNVVNLEGWQEQIDNLGFELIVGCVLNNGKKIQNGLFTVNLKGVAEFIDTYCVIGSGFLFAEYVLSRLYRKELNIFEAMNIIIYVIEEVKKNDPNCGGDTKISAISNDMGIMPNEIKRGLIKAKTKWVKEIDKKVIDIWQEWIIESAQKIKETARKITKNVKDN